MYAVLKVLGGGIKYLFDLDFQRVNGELNYVDLLQILGNH